MVASANATYATAAAVSVSVDCYLVGAESEALS